MESEHSEPVVVKKKEQPSETRVVQERKPTFVPIIA
jgi:hypothetical protein